MLTAMLDAGSAARRVGYVSSSQFTREYGRFSAPHPRRTSRGCANRASPCVTLPRESKGMDMRRNSVHVFALADRDPQRGMHDGH